MKILIINTLYSPEIGGGAEIIVQTLTEGLKRNGHMVTVLTTMKNRGKRIDIVNGIRIIRVGLKNIYYHHTKQILSSWKRSLWHCIDTYNPFMACEVSKVLISERPDIVMTHNLVGFSASIWHAVAKAGIPIMHVIHDMYHLCPRSVMYKENSTCDKQCKSCQILRYFHPYHSSLVNAVIGVSRFVLQAHLDKGYFKNSIIREHIYNVKPVSSITMRNDKTNKPLCFGYIGTLAPHKGINLLLEVFVKIANQNIKLRVAGNGKDEYVKSLKNCYSDARIDFMGHEKPEDFYPNIDVLIFPSTCSEALGISVSEAFGYGKPVIGSKLGGIPEMIKDGFNGYLFNPDKPEELQKLIQYYIDSPDKAREMNRAALLSAQPFIDIDRFISNYETVIEKTIIACHSAVPLSRFHY